MWLDIFREKDEIEKKLHELENRRPNLDIFFDDETKVVTLNSLITIKKLRETNTASPIGNVFGIATSVTRLVDNLSILSTPFGNSALTNKIIDEIEKEYVPVKLILENKGNATATKVNIHISFSDDFQIIKKYPNKGMYLIDHIISSSPRIKGLILHTDKTVQLWVEEALHPFKIELPTFYVSVRKKDIFRVKYTINAYELVADEISGELTFRGEPIFQERIFDNKAKLGEENKERENLLNNPSVKGI